MTVKDQQECLMVSVSNAELRLREKNEQWNMTFVRGAHQLITHR